jgi:hypothetical protein
MKRRNSFEIKNAITITGIFICSILHSFGQPETDSVFSREEPMDIRLEISLKQMRNSTKDTSWVSDKLYYRNGSGSFDSIKIDLKGRGHFRLTECYFPPLWIKIDKKDAKGTAFDGNKKLKLVLPCKTYKEDNPLILREYLCYKLWEVISPYAFKTRLVNVDLTERGGKKNKNFQLKGILIEDLEKAAKRLNAEPKTDLKIAAWNLEDTNVLRFYMFQYLIANTDWSTTAQHNSKLILLPNRSYIPLPYDFDLSGVVNAHYAFVSLAGDVELPIENVRQRLYRGFCNPLGATQYVRVEIRAKEAALLSVPDLLKGQLDDKEISGIKSYLKEFFDILKSDYLFRDNILDKCRSTN